MVWIRCSLRGVRLLTSNNFFQNRHNSSLVEFPVSIRKHVRSWNKLSINFGFCAKHQGIGTVNRVELNPPHFVARANKRSISAVAPLSRKNSKTQASRSLGILFEKIPAKDSAFEELDHLILVYSAAMP